MIFSDKVEYTYGDFTSSRAQEIAALAKRFGGKAKTLPAGRGSTMLRVKVTFHEHSPAASMAAFGRFRTAFKAGVVQAWVEKYGTEPNETTLGALMGSQRNNPASKRSFHADYSAKSIGESNAAMALDSFARGTRTAYATRAAALAAYLVNTCDTAREHNVSREEAVEAFLKYIQPKRKPARSSR